MASGTIRVGIGGWTYEPWRGTFYPPGLPHARELDHAARQVTAIDSIHRGGKQQAWHRIARRLLLRVTGEVEEADL